MDMQVNFNFLYGFMHNFTSCNTHWNCLTVAILCSCGYMYVDSLLVWYGYLTSRARVCDAG